MHTGDPYIAVIASMVPPGGAWMFMLLVPVSFLPPWAQLGIPGSSCAQQYWCFQLRQFLGVLLACLTVLGGGAVTIVVTRLYCPVAYAVRHLLLGAVYHPFLSPGGWQRIVTAVEDTSLDHDPSH